MSRVDDLIANYARFVKLPWPTGLAPAQRVWMAVYSPEEERRLRLELPGFAAATKSAGYEWDLIDLTVEFETWIARHDYREQYFRSPNLIQPELAGFFDHVVASTREQLSSKTSDHTVVGVLGAGSLFGLGAHVKVSALIEHVQDATDGRLLVFFPGEVDGNNYRLLGAQDGWNYLATLITAQKGSTL